MNMEYQSGSKAVNKNSQSLPTSAAIEIADRLRHMILTGEIEPGARLTQRDLAARFGLSAMPARDAIKRLLGEGLVVHEGQKTIVVAPLRASDFIDIMEMRALLEPVALKLSGPRLTEEDLAESEAILKEGQRDDEPFTYVSRHWAFHRSLYRRAGRPRLLASIEAQHMHLNRYLMPKWAGVEDGAHWAETEWKLLDLVTNKQWTEADAYLRMDIERIVLNIIRTLPAQT